MATSSREQANEAFRRQVVTRTVEVKALQARVAELEAEVERLQKDYEDLSARGLPVLAEVERLREERDRYKEAWRPHWGGGEEVFPERQG